MKAVSPRPTDVMQELRARTAQNRSMSSLEQAAILMLSMGDGVCAGVLKHFSREDALSDANLHLWGTEL